MKYLETIREFSQEPEKLEKLYQEIPPANRAEFADDLFACYQAAPDNLLLAAWHFRLKDAPPSERSGGIQWKIAAPLAVLNALLFWLLSDTDWLFVHYYPNILLVWSGIAAIFILAFLALTTRQNLLRSLWSGLGVAALTVFALWVTPRMPESWQEHFAILLILHLPLMAWAAVGMGVLGFKSNAQERFSFLIKSLEAIITGGLYLGAIGVFTGITLGLFSALGIELDDLVMRLLAFGGTGLIPVIAVASVYDPQRTPSQQDFGQGLSKFIAQTMRLLLPMTLLVGFIYTLFIPFNFLAPFENRDVLIVYNVMLFAVMGLQLGATPLRAEDLPLRLRAILRNGLLVLAILAILVSLYALSATAYRTIQNDITINRLVILGWNTINIGILGLIIQRLLRRAADDWVGAMHNVFCIATNAYLIWGLFVILAIPLLFR